MRDDEDVVLLDRSRVSGPLCHSDWLGVAVNMAWTDVDLERGRITIRASKTGRTRVLPLVGAPEGDVAPVFLELLKKWREGDDRQGVRLAPHWCRGAGVSQVRVAGHQ